MLYRSRSTPYSDAEIKVCPLITISKLLSSYCILFNFFFRSDYRMLSGKKQWSTIQIKTRTIKVNNPLFWSEFVALYIYVRGSEIKSSLFALWDAFIYAAEAAEAKFKEVMTSYEAIKLERKNGTCWIHIWRTDVNKYYVWYGKLMSIVVIPILLSFFFFFHFYFAHLCKFVHFNMGLIMLAYHQLYEIVFLEIFPNYFRR